MLYEGQKEDALKCISAIRARFDGAKRNPFNEPECGHHYARSIASWAAVLALSDFHYSGVDKRMSFTSEPGTYFWNNGYAWGTCKIENDGQVVLSVLKGSLNLNELVIGDKHIKVKNKQIVEKDIWTIHL